MILARGSSLDEQSKPPGGNGTGNLTDNPMDIDQTVAKRNTLAVRAEFRIPDDPTTFRPLENFLGLANNIWDRDPHAIIFDRSKTTPFRDANTLPTAEADFREAFEYVTQTQKANDKKPKYATMKFIIESSLTLGQLKQKYKPLQNYINENKIYLRQDKLEATITTTAGYILFKHPRMTSDIMLEDAYGNGINELWASALDNCDPNQMHPRTHLQLYEICRRKMLHKSDPTSKPFEIEILEFRCAQKDAGRIINMIQAADLDETKYGKFVSRRASLQDPNAFNELLRAHANFVEDHAAITIMGVPKSMMLSSPSDSSYTYLTDLLNAKAPNGRPVFNGIEQTSRTSTEGRWLAVATRANIPYARDILNSHFETMKLEQASIWQQMKPFGKHFADGPRCYAPSIHTTTSTPTGYNTDYFDKRRTPRGWKTPETTKPIQWDAKEFPLLTPELAGRDLPRSIFPETPTEQAQDDQTVRRSHTPTSSLGSASYATLLTTVNDLQSQVQSMQTERTQREKREKEFMEQMQQMVTTTVQGMMTTMTQTMTAQMKEMMKPTPIETPTSPTTMTPSTMTPDPTQNELEKLQAAHAQLQQDYNLMFQTLVESHSQTYQAQAQERATLPSQDDENEIYDSKQPARRSPGSKLPPAKKPKSTTTRRNAKGSVKSHDESHDPTADMAMEE